MDNFIQEIIEKWSTYFQDRGLPLREAICIAGPFLKKPKRARLRLKSSFFFQKTYFLGKKAGKAFAN